MNAAVMANKVHPNTAHVYNLITLIVKQYMFSCKCLQQKPSVKQIMLHLNYIIKLDYSMLQQL